MSTDKVLQLSAKPVHSIGGTLNETTLSTLQIKNELFAPQFRYAHLQVLWPRMAKDDYFVVSKTRKQLTDSQTGCRKLSMKVPRNQNSNFSPVVRLSFAGYYAYRGNFMQKSSHSRTISAFVTAHTLTKNQNILLSEVRGKTGIPTKSSTFRFLALKTLPPHTHPISHARPLNA